MKIIVIVFAMLMVTGCASPYMTDRGRDLADVVTVTVGEGGGVKARCGIINVGMFLNSDYCGLRGGEFFCGKEKKDSSNEITSILPIPMVMVFVFLNENFIINGVPTERHKSFEAVGLYVPFVMTDLDSPSGLHYTPYSYYTQCEVAVAVWGSLRVGVNPGELLDFVLGWTTLDIYGDDIAGKDNDVKEKKAVSQKKVKKNKKHVSKDN